MLKRSIGHRSKLRSFHYTCHLLLLAFESTEDPRVNFEKRFALKKIYTWTLCHSYLHEKQTSRIQSLNEPINIPANTTTLNQRWFNFSFQRCINVEIRLDLKVEWTLFQRCRRCFNVVSMLFRRCFNVVSTFIRCFINLVITSFFWYTQYVFNKSYKKPFFLLYSNYYFSLWHKINCLTLLLKCTLVCSLATNSTDSQIYVSRFHNMVPPTSFCLRFVQFRTFPTMRRKKNSIFNWMYKQVQQLTWLTSSILSNRIIFCKSKIFLCSPLIPHTGRWLIVTETPRPACVHLALCLFGSMYMM